ncbi:hypothetical protein Glove_81g69 [Diversispora epigaea]|uniref:Protein kinase domain-containing protein n=1 Tax=Diversispora epigaea TaxID=1348612 RepID=A0A397JAE9_9GLOM|nr:hypothetical protein Glove_81g69 [Diversispora epigaea]
MPQEKEIVYCSAGHSYNNNNYKNYIDVSSGICELCIKNHFIHEFETWSSGNVEIDKVIRESQISYQKYYNYRLQWIPYDNFQNIKYIADGGYGSVYSAKLINGIKKYWNFNKQDWKWDFKDYKVALKEIKDSRHDISKFLKEIRNIQIVKNQYFIISCFGISRNPSSQNYIIVMELHDDNLHKFVTKSFLNLDWKSKINLLYNIAIGLDYLHIKNLVHRDLHSGNILVKRYSYNASISDLGLCSLENDLILKSNNNNVYGSIPYIPPEVLRGNIFTKNGDIYSFGIIMYEIATGKQPFSDRAHDTHLIIDICNGVRPKIPDIMLNWIPEWYLDLMYRCWSGDPSNRPTANELFYAFYELVILRNDIFESEEFYIDNDILRQFIIADENRFEFQRQKSFLSSSMSHPQSCYISRNIHTLYGLHNSLEDIKSGKSQDPNLLRYNESTASNTYDIDSKESQECIDWENEIQIMQKKRSFSTLYCDSQEFKEYINLDKDNIILKKLKKGS